MANLNLQRKVFVLQMRFSLPKIFETGSSLEDYRAVTTPHIIGRLLLVIDTAFPCNVELLGGSFGPYLPSTQHPPNICVI